MCTGHTLFHNDTNGNLTDGNAFAELFNWNDKTKEAKLAKVSCPLARELLGTLLSKNPERRLNVDSVLESRFFRCTDFGSDDYRVKVAELIKDEARNNEFVIEFDNNVNRSTSAMCKAVFSLE